MKTIVQIFARDFQEPPRIIQMCRDLSKEGFGVYRLLLKKKKRKKNYSEKFKTIVVEKKGFLSEEPVNKISFFDLIFFGFFGAKKLKKIDNKKNISIIHCHRHSSLLPAFISKLLGVKAKIILDYHDPWSGESTLKEGDEISWISKIKIKVFHTFEKISLRNIDHVVVVSNPQKKLIMKKHNLKEDIFTIVSNSAATANESYFNPKIKNKKKFGWQGKKVVLFTGCIVPYFGIDLLIEAIAMVVKKIPNILCIIKIAEEIKEKEYYQNLLQKIKNYGLQKNIKFIEEWMDEKKYAQFVCSSDLGIICHQPTLLTKTADPDKLYEYLAAGLPIVTTDLEIMKRYVKDKKNGFIVPHNPKEISKAIIKILNDKSLMKKMGKESHNMKFDWRDDFNRLLKTYNKFYNEK